MTTPTEPHNLGKLARERLHERTKVIRAFLGEHLDSETVEAILRSREYLPFTGRITPKNLGNPETRSALEDELNEVARALRGISEEIWGPRKSGSVHISDSPSIPVWRATWRPEGPISQAEQANFPQSRRDHVFAIGVGH